jgi:hypothetical protein
MATIPVTWPALWGTAAWVHAPSPKTSMLASKLVPLNPPTTIVSDWTASVFRVPSIGGIARKASIGAAVGPAEGDTGASPEGAALVGWLARTLGEGTTCDPCSDCDAVEQPPRVSATRTAASERTDGSICRQR